jgi:hypothetical protein
VVKQACEVVDSRVCEILDLLRSEATSEVLPEDELLAIVLDLRLEDRKVEFLELP